MSVFDDAAGWHTAALLLKELGTDFGSHTYAAKNKFEYPISPEDTTLRNLYDLVSGLLAGRRGPQYPKPRIEKEVVRIGQHLDMSPRQARMLLDQYSPIKGGNHGR